MTHTKESPVFPGRSETPLANVDGQYENGMAQPAVIAESSSGTKLYEWIIVPAEMNFGGAKDRPLVEHVLADIKLALVNGQRSNGQRSHLKDTKTTDMAYLETRHPTEFEQVQEYIASLKS